MIILTPLQAEGRYEAPLRRGQGQRPLRHQRPGQDRLPHDQLYVLFRLFDYVTDVA